MHVTEAVIPSLKKDEIISTGKQQIPELLKEIVYLITWDEFIIPWFKTHILKYQRWVHYKVIFWEDKMIGKIKFQNIEVGGLHQA